MTNHTGKCLCGDVAFSVEVEKKEAGTCYCGMCRHWSAGPFMAVHGAHAPVVENADALGIYDSSDWGQRCFCKKCGTNLFWQAKDASFFGVAVDALDDAEGFALKSEIFVDKIPHYYQPASDISRMTEAEFMAMVAAEGSE